MSDLRTLLTRRWLHSHEEDTAEETVYRPADYPFPPSRGRMGFELRPDGTLVRIGIAARDGVTAQPGHWSVSEGDSPELALRSGGSEEVLRVKAVDADRLTIRK